MADPCQFIIFHFLGLLDPWGFFDFDYWHQWQLPILTNNFPLCHWWQFPFYSPFHHVVLAPPVIMLFQFYLPLWHQWQRECLLMFSHLAFWGGNHSQFLSEILKDLPWKRLSEDVCNLFLCLNVFQFDVLFCDLFSYKVKLDGYVFCFGMHHWVLGYIYCTGVIIEYWSGLIIFYLYVLCFPHLGNLGTTCCHYNILCFCYR